MPTVLPKPWALTTVDAFLDYINEPADQNGKKADRAQRLINSYSAAVNRYTKRQWQPLEDGTDKVFAYSGNGYLSLAPFEAREIYTVTLYTDLADASWLVMPARSSTQESQWRVNPRQRSQEGTYWWLTMPELGPYHPYYDEPITTLNRRNLGYEATVNGDWGVDFADIPDDVQLALWEACANAWTNPGANRTRQLGPVTTTDYESFVPGTEEGLYLPRAARSLLSPYRRRGAGVR
jgi:hypothetical protein